MNTNIPTQTNPAYEGGKPTTAEHQDGYSHQQTPYANEMQEKRPLHHVTQGEAFQGTQPQDTQDPNRFRSERDDAGYGNNVAPNMNAGESEQHPIPPNQRDPSLRSEKATLGHGAEPAPSYQEDAYGNQQQVPRANESPGQQGPLHHVTKGDAFQGTQPQDTQDPNRFRSERDDAGYRDNVAPNMYAGESEQHPIPPNQRDPSLRSEKATVGHGAEPAPSYQEDAYGNQQQAPRAYEVPEKPPVHPSRQGERFQGTQFNHPAAAGVQPEQDHAFAGTDRNAANANQMPPNHDGHAGAMYQDQRHPGENAHTGGPGFNQGHPGNYTGFGGNRNGPAAGNYAGDKYGQQRATAGTTGGSWRTDPVGTLSSYLSHPTVSTTTNQMFSGGPFDTNRPGSLEPSSREARHLKMNGKMEEMAGKMFGSESMQRRGQEKAAMGRDMAAQVRQTGKLRGNDGGVGGGMTGQDAGAPPAGQGMGPSVQGGQGPRGY